MDNAKVTEFVNRFMPLYQEFDDFCITGGAVDDETEAERQYYADALKPFEAEFKALHVPCIVINDMPMVNGESGTQTVIMAYPNGELYVQYNVVPVLNFWDNVGCRSI